MDFDSLKTKVSNLTLYDIKAGVRQVQNAVMNLTEMESKVREATNADPWGAPSSLMQEIASGTHNYQQLNEIMPMIYKRFTDKTAEEWRQIYKSLQLLEFLIKNGSERVVDDARSHLSLIRMLRQFHYIDPNGKDQGINVRNRSNELAKLLSDVDAIRQERKKARVNKNKYGGVEGGAGFSGSSSRYGGFGSETGGFGSGSAGGGYGGYGGEVYGDGGGFGGQDPEMSFSTTQKRGDQFEEYDEGDDGGSSSVSRAPARTTASSSARREQPKPKPKPKEPEQDLFDFGDEPAAVSAPAAASNGHSALDDFGPTQSSTAAADDDFDDFQSASPAPAQANVNPLATFSPPPPSTFTTTSATQFAAPQPIAASQPAALNSILSAPSPAPSTASSIAAPSAVPAAAPKPLQPAGGFKSSGPNYYTSVRADINTSGASTPSAFQAQRSQVTSPTASTYTPSTSAAQLGKQINTAPKPAAGGDAFGSLWSTASSKAGVQQKAPAAKGPGLADMAKQKSSAGIWGAASASSSSVNRPSNPTPTLAAQPQQQKPATPLGNGLDDLLG